MAKKSFKSGIDNLIENSLDDFNQITNNVNEEKSENKEISNIGNINIDDISDEKVKWLFIKLKRFQDELKLWRTGKLNPDVFEKSLKEKGLTYNPDKNEIEEI